MELTQYNRFYGLFKYMHGAVFTTLTKTTESDDFCTIELKNNIQQIMIDTNEFENISFDDIMNEFKQNLYTLTKENKKSFIIGSLQQWIQFAPYFDIRNDREIYWIEGLAVNTNTEFYNTAKNTIKKNERIPVYLKDSIFEKYIFLCYLKKNQFFNLLSDFCSLLSIDFNKLQDKVATPPENAKHNESEKTITAKNNLPPKVENETKSYIIKSDDIIRKIYDTCQEAFECDYLAFRQCIETANFNRLNIKKKNMVQDLTFRLSGIMDNNWYSDVCKIMNWEKRRCSGQGQKLENNQITSKLDKILKRPKKE